MYSKIKYKDIEVSYLWKLNGGGIIFAHEYVRVIAKTGKVGHVFEYCAGPGYIGFALLAHGLCDRLTLSDVNPEAVAAIQDTIKNNHLEDRVSVYQSDGLDAIPKDERWDLVVGNPPWWICSEPRQNIRVCDPKGIVHDKFFRAIGPFLRLQGKILLVEGGEYTNPIHFKGMIDQNGLKISSSFDAVVLRDFFKGYKEYKGLHIPFIVFLRLCLYVREVYFIWIDKSEGKIKAVSTIAEGQRLQVLRKQRVLFWVYLAMMASYVFLLTPLGSLPVFMFWLWAMFLVLHLAMALEKRRPEFWFFAMLIPLVKLILPPILLWQSRKVTDTFSKTEESPLRVSS